MTEHIFNIQIPVSFRYDKSEDGTHILFLEGTFTSPITNKIHSISTAIRSGASDAEYEFYKGTENIMTNMYSLKGFIAPPMADILKQEYAELGGESIDEIAKKKFFERLATSFNLDVYIDLTKDYQTGTN